MILVKSGPTGRDETAPYDVFDYPKKVNDFIQEVLKRINEWGDIEIQGYGSIEYKYGKPLTNIPKLWDNLIISNVKASGGWSYMCYYISVEQQEKIPSCIGFYEKDNAVVVVCGGKIGFQIRENTYNNTPFVAIDMKELEENVGVGGDTTNVKFAKNNHTVRILAYEPRSITSIIKALIKAQDRLFELTGAECQKDKYDKLKAVSHKLYTAAQYLSDNPNSAEALREAMKEYYNFINNIKV